MDLGMVLSVAQTVFAALQCQELRDVWSFLGYESELENLARTLDTVKAVLQEAEIMQMQAELPPKAQRYIDELKNAVYDADDLLDEFVSVAQRKKLSKGGEISEKFRLLLSSFNPLATANRMSRGVKEIRKRLDGIASDHTKYGFKFESKPILRRREETCSYLHAQDVIGREDDIDKIMRKLLDPDVKRNVSCLAIVGMGGLGKTALARLVCNHPRTQENFPLRLWTCVADQDEKTLDVKGVLSKILHSLTHGNHGDLTLETLQKQLRDQLAGKKYLIVLDDVWSENRLRLLDLANYMTTCLKGSWIVVTTRSQQTARILGDELVHELKGLSEKDSWHLFERTAFGEGHKQANALDLVKIGREIVKSCVGVPLAIKVVGSLLYGHPNPKEKWASFQKKGLGSLKDGEGDGIEPILKLSYHHLDSPLKACFSYCALFPKDHVIRKGQLLNLWMAQDYVVPEKGQSLQDASEEYFSILVRRCFFQDVQKDEYGEISGCKIHDLMHDLAQEVAGKEIYATNSFTTNLDNKIRHLSYMSTGEGIQWPFTRNKIRTCLHIGDKEQCIPVNKLLKHWMCLRALDLSRSSIKTLPNGLDKLLHLRYLDLSYNRELETLPNSVTKLHNLQTLILQGCFQLRELPESLPKLVKLRVLDVGSFFLGINKMPRGMGKLSCLQQLPLFVVGDNNATTKQSIVEQKEELKALTDLKGSLEIKILNNTEYIVENAGERSYIRNKQHLSRVVIQFPWAEEEHNRMRDDEEVLLLEDLQPHPKLRELGLWYYMGSRMPSWATEDNLAISLPNLVKVSFGGCYALPSLRKFRDLKHLELFGLEDLEYIENTTRRRNISDGAGTSELDAFFPSLETLHLANMPKLKGWWRDEEISNSNGKHGHQLLPSFPHLIELRIKGCPNLTCIPPCPTVEDLEFEGKISENLVIMVTSESGNSKLRNVTTENARCLKTISPMEGFQCLERMRISWDGEVESLSEVGEVFRSCSSSLKSLRIWKCQQLKSLCGALEHLTALESIEISDTPSLNLDDKEVGENDDGKPWQCLHQRLRFLKLQKLPELESLPKGMQYLTALQSLYIIDCKRLESLPESMPKLTSLKTLEIRACSAELNERCREPTGDDWPKIQHIPHVAIRD